MAIRKLVRENAALVVGIALPVVVVVLFLLATHIPRLLVDPPRYDFLFTTQEYPKRESRWRYEVEVDSANKLQVWVFTIQPDGPSHSDRLYRYEHSSGSIREITMPRPDTTELPEVGVLVEVPEFDDQAIDPRRVAPDGYELLEPRSSRGFLVGVFYERNRRSRAIGRDGALVELPLGADLDWHRFHFLGWVIPPPNQ